jgi:hypothetical protein
MAKSCYILADYDAVAPITSLREVPVSRARTQRLVSDSECSGLARAVCY